VGRDINIQHNIQYIHQYFVSSGVVPYQDYLNGVLTPTELANQGVLNVDELRRKLLQVKTIPDPVCVTVRGTLFPCALLTAGWWDRHETSARATLKWHDNIQKWLFTGFDLWGPSWDFTWDAGHDTPNSYVIAQLGYGDEADSLPVLIPRKDVCGLTAFFQENWGGGEVEVTGLLGHRSQFVKAHYGVELVGGLLDYCLWIDEDNRQHGISALNYETEIYSGYLWKCVTPRAWTDLGKTLTLDKVYFIWEHTNFCSQEAIKYNLESLNHKEEYISRMHGDLILLQKSSQLVPGDPLWSTGEFYDVFLQKKKRIC
jgi:hypothetical protein